MRAGSRRRFLFVLLALFVGSGCAALIYEIVWFQLLQLVIGSSAVSIGVLLGTFMGGMCIGSLALPHLISARHHPLRVYAALELSTGIAAVIVAFAVPLAAGLYTASVGHGMPGIFLRALVCALCLLPPTILMGATLPAIARWLAPSDHGLSWLGLLYGGNIAGAVLGSMIAGFYLLRVHDLATAIFAAAGINAAVAAIAFGASLVIAHEPATAISAPRPQAHGAENGWPVYLAIGLSGASALGAEVVWTRVLALMFGATTYTFSIILAVFLTGLGLGSAGASLLLRRRPNARVALGACQAMLAVIVAATASLLARSLPYWPGSDGAAGTAPVFLFDLMRSMFALLPATCLWGASFPLALAASEPHADDAGHLVGRVYAANTLGAIVGAIGFSILAVPLAGTGHAQQLIIVLSAAAGLLMLMPKSLPGRASLTAVAVVAIAALAWSVPAVPPRLVAYGRALASNDRASILYVDEGINSSVAVSESPSGIRTFHVGGNAEASTEPLDLRLQRMLGSMPALLHPNPQSVLVAGFGSGVTAGSVLPHPGVHHVVICEVEPSIPARVAPFFAVQNFSVLADARAHLVTDDARHYVLTSHETFDLVTSEPVRPWVKGATALYTQEYFRLLKEHLNPGGMVVQWVPIHGSQLDVVKSEIATFLAVFPDSTIWGSPSASQGYDLILMGSADEHSPSIDVDRLQERLNRPEFGPLAAALGSVGFPSAIELLATYAGAGSELAPWLTGAEINRDRSLRLQYLTGPGLSPYESADIYDEILAYRRLPSDRFIAAEATKRRLWDAAARLRTGP